MAISIILMSINIFSIYQKLHHLSRLYTFFANYFLYLISLFCAWMFTKNVKFCISYALTPFGIVLKLSLLQLLFKRCLMFPMSSFACIRKSYNTKLIKQCKSCFANKIERFTSKTYLISKKNRKRMKSSFISK